MTMCTCGRGFELQSFTDSPKLDSLCPKCLLASNPTNEDQEFSLEELEQAFQRDVNEDNYLEKGYAYG